VCALSPQAANILPDPKTKQEGKDQMLDKLMLWTNRFQVKSLFLNTWMKKETKSKPTAANPKSKTVKLFGGLKQI
jgi:hypothetical protein